MLHRTVFEVQNDLARSCGHGMEIVWDSLSGDQAEILKEKIKNILPDDDQRQNEIEKARNNMFQNVWAQRKHTNRVLLSSIIYVMVTEEKDYEASKQSTNFSFHPVIRTRKCLSLNNSSGCCMIFIDEHSRIYQNWQQYLKNNILPSGTMIAPANGIYTLNENDEIDLEICATPNSNSRKKIETAIGVGGIISGTAPLALSMVMPIAAPVMLTATVVSLATSAYTALRSATFLTDRYKHGQTTSLTDREARSKWLGVAGGVAGLGASGAMNALAYANSAGKGVPLMAKVAVGGVNVTSLVLSGSDIVNTVYDLYLSYDEGPSSLDILQLASSLLVFTHSINNLALVTKIPTRGGSASLRRAIRKQTRNSYDKISSECMRMGKNFTKMDLIRVVNNIPSKEAFIQQVGTLLAQATAGTVVGNAVSELPHLINYTLDGELNPIQLLAAAGFKFVRNILDSNSFIDLLNTMANFMCEKSFYLLMNLTRTFMDEFGDTINDVLRTLIPTEKVLYELFMLCVRKYSNLTYDFLENKQTEILDELERYFYSLNPIDDSNKSISCKICKGYYYECAL
uniref:Urocanate hydratase n=1 Tax=Zeugodacus cucurbitae TaxID=28588 RepID=A0A0A1WZT1_ZEUCU